VNVTLEPAQIVEAEVAIVTDGGVVGLMVIPTLLDVPVDGDAQPKFDVITQVTVSRLFNEVDP
jgi:hypothetical protein